MKRGKRKRGKRKREKRKRKRGKRKRKRKRGKEKEKEKEKNQGFLPSFGRICILYGEIERFVGTRVNWDLSPLGPLGGCGLWSFLSNSIISPPVFLVVGKKKGKGYDTHTPVRSLEGLKTCKEKSCL